MGIGCALLAIGIAWLDGCATKEPAGSAPRPKDGIKEYRQIVTAARKAMASAIQALNQVSAETNKCPAAVLRDFTRAEERLQVDSVKVRERSQAMEQRGDAYFAQWEDHLAQVKDPELRKLAEERRPELEQSFAKIKASAKQTRAVFRPFLGDLRKLRSALENDPASVSGEATRALVHSAQNDGQQVQKGLATIQGELDRLAGLLQPGKGGAKK
jgi:hypothetical protein